MRRHLYDIRFSLLILLALLVGLGVAWGGDEDVFTVKSTLHTIRFQATLSLGGDLVLNFSDNELFGMENAFERWLMNMTLKELNEKGYLSGRIIPKEIEEGK